MDKHKNSDPRGARDAAHLLGNGAREPANSGPTRERTQAMDKQVHEDAVPEFPKLRADVINATASGSFRVNSMTVQI
jgi:hypothetical protein